MADGIEVRRVDGRLAVVVAASPELLEVALMLRQANDVRVRNRRMPVLAATDLEQALRFAARAADLMTVPHGEQVLAPNGPAEQVLSVPEVARLAGITPRGVRRRIESGRLRATRTGRDWLIRLDDLRKESA